MRAALAIVAAIVVSIGGCGGTTSTVTPETPSSGTGAAGVGSPGDIAFLENMVIHHQQALELAALVPGRTTDPALVALADQITAQRQTELQGCQAQLLQWEAPGRAPGTPDADGIPGMLDQATVDKLRSLHGPAFDKLWLTSMIGHHRGVITMAHDEIENGQSPEAISIAQSLAPRQQAEIDQMTALLGET